MHNVHIVVRDKENAIIRQTYVGPITYIHGSVGELRIGCPANRELLLASTSDNVLELISETLVKIYVYGESIHNSYDLSSDLSVSITGICEPFPSEDED